MYVAPAMPFCVSVERECDRGGYMVACCCNKNPPIQLRNQRSWWKQWTCRRGPAGPCSAEPKTTHDIYVVHLYTYRYNMKNGWQWLQHYISSAVSPIQGLNDSCVHRLVPKTRANPLSSSRR